MSIPVEEVEDYSAARLKRELVAWERKTYPERFADLKELSDDVDDCDDRPPPPDFDPPPAGGGGDDFQRDDKNRIFKNKHNVKVALRNLGVSLRYDEFGDRELLSGLPDFGPELDDAAVIRLRFLIDERFYFKLDKGEFYDVLGDIARDARFNPVRDYLSSLRWDGTERLSYWLVDHFGAEDTYLNRAISRIVLIAAVRRALHPGCKFDEMLVLESGQGLSKSTALRALVPTEDLFSDNFTLAVETKEHMEQMAGKWIVEAGELSGMNRGDLNAIKQFLARQEDEARLAYGRKRTKRKRQCIFIGTTNEQDGYLNDRTGNRRFWPVRVCEVDVPGLLAMRDHLWAEAVVAEAAGESIRLARELWEAAAVEQEEREVEDPFLEQLHTAFGDLVGKIRTLDCYAILGIRPGESTPAQTARLHAAMRKLGWERQKPRFKVEGEGSRTSWGFVKGGELERQVQLQVNGQWPHAQVEKRKAS